MSSNWNNGILKCNTVNNLDAADDNRNSTDLFIFGYACKIFRDDDKAIYIDQGKHLISWMGDENLKIDRYDVRSTLSDLSQHEPPPGGYGNRLHYLSASEQRAEQLCEEERYYSLYHNDEEEKMYQEEELKRLHQQRSSTYGQVQFDYDKQQNAEFSEEKDSTSTDDNEIFICPVNLNIPNTIQKPETMKLHAIIEKTAKFISTQGPQMEILIKAKQSNNPQFEFLNINHALNPYYKFILEEFKNGTYPETNINQNESGDQKKNDLESSNISEQTNINYAIPIPTIEYKPSVNCAYTQLISKIKGFPLPPKQPDPPLNNLTPDSTTPTLLTHHYSFQSNNYDIVGTIKSENYKKSNNKNESSNSVVSKNGEELKIEVKKISTGLALAQCYASDSEEENEENNQKEDNENQSNLNFPIPPEYLQHIIDKTAAYVIKNGKQFEDTLRTKQDNRFLFLDPNNEYHLYYKYKVTGVVPPFPTVNETSEDSSKRQKNINPVSFSIKTKEEAPISIKAALSQEVSDDESETKKNVEEINIDTNSQKNVTINTISKINVPEGVQKNISNYVDNLVLKKEVKPVPITTSSIEIQPIMATSSTKSKESGQKTKFDLDNPENFNHSVITQPLNPIQIKSESIQQKEIKRAEERVKDRLAQIAREKLGLISKEKQLQLERKKKAMAFLNQIKDSPASANINNIGKYNIESDTSVFNTPVQLVSILENNFKNNQIIEEKEENKRNALEKGKNDKIYSVTLDNLSSKSIRRKSRSKSRSKNRSKSRSRSRSKRSSSTHKKKKKSKHHTKKKSKNRSRSRSRSKSNCRTTKSTKDYHDRSRNYCSTSYSSSRDKKRKRHSPTLQMSKKEKNY